MLKTLELDKIWSCSRVKFTSGIGHSLLFNVDLNVESRATTISCHGDRLPVDWSTKTCHKNGNLRTEVLQISNVNETPSVA